MTQAPWKYENDSMMIDPASHKIVVGARIFGNGGFLVGEVYRAEPDDVKVIEASAEMLIALKDAKEVLETAKKYFPKSIQNRDRFHLLNVLANSVEKAINKAEGR